MRRVGAWVAGLALLTNAALAADLQGHGGPVRALAAQSDRIYSGSFDTRAIVWEAGVARQVTQIHSGAVTSVLPLSDGRFASGGQDGHIAIWDGGAEPVRFEEVHAMPVADLAAWQGGLASASWDGTIALWDTQSAPRKIEGHDGQITGLIAYGDGLASVGADLRLRIWSADGQLTSTIDLPATPADLATDGEALFIAGADGLIYRVQTGEPTREAELTNRSLISIVASPDAVVASGMQGQVWILDPDTLQLRSMFDSGQGTVWALALQKSNVLTGGNDGWIRRWTLQGDALGSGSETTKLTLTNPRGAKVFQACAVCHALTPDDQHRAGPTLHQIFGRKIATAEGYDYSKALRSLDIVWTPQTVSELFEFGPTAYTPGSRMPEQRIPSETDRQALVEFLMQTTR